MPRCSIYKWHVTYVSWPHIYPHDCDLTHDPRPATRDPATRDPHKACLQNAGFDSCDSPHLAVLTITSESFLLQPGQKPSNHQQSTPGGMSPLPLAMHAGNHDVIGLAFLCLCVMFLFVFCLPSGITHWLFVRLNVISLGIFSLSDLFQTLCGIFILSNTVPDWSHTTQV